MQGRQKYQTDFAVGVIIPTLQMRKWGANIKWQSPDEIVNPALGIIGQVMVW